VSDVTHLPPPPELPELLSGPFTVWRVIVDGRTIPGLTGFRDAEGIWLVVDERFGGGPFTEESARQAASLIAQALAIGAGYSHIGAESKDRPFAPLTFALDGVPGGSGGGRGE
jgi:hypothetical protein